ncbi:MAG: glycosyltransferase [Cyanothece sp. SIO1E1]|nr:glycosyltransferase [Cyanothece sp. SIO1E1]
MDKISDLFQKLYLLKLVYEQEGVSGLLIFFYRRTKEKLFGKAAYHQWLAKHRLKSQDISVALRQISSLSYQPCFSFIMITCNAEEKCFKRAIRSIRTQIYPHWELCIVDNASTEPSFHVLLKQYSQLEARISIKFQTSKQDISVASNSALELVKGDYVAFLGQNDELAIDALFENARLINQHSEADFIYSDEDNINLQGKRSNPFFKPNWSPDYFYSFMYTQNLGVYRASLIREIGGFRNEYEGAQDYDLLLRIIEKTQNIYHISKVLYHCRIFLASGKSEAQSGTQATTHLKAYQALEAMLERNSDLGWVETGPHPGLFRVRRHLVNHPLVSIIIPSAAKTIDAPSGSVCLLMQCLQSIQNLSTYSNFEIIVVDGYDIPERILAAINLPNLHLVRCGEPFNFSMRMNRGAAKANGQFLLMLNDDVEVLTPNWLECMLELAQQTEIGAVGAKLLFPDQTLQHAGVIIPACNPSHAFAGVEANHPGYFYSNIVNRNYIAVTAACLMLRRDVFDQVGGFDETFPLNYNDVDLCLKIHQADYRNVVTPYVQLIHYESATRYKGLKSGELEAFSSKWSGYLQAFGTDPYYNPNLHPYTLNFDAFR